MEHIPCHPSTNPVARAPQPSGRSSTTAGMIFSQITSGITISSTTSSGTPRKKQIPSKRLALESSVFFTPQMALLRKKTPVILGEFSSFDFVEKTFEKAIDNMILVRDLALKEHVNGMLFWTYDSFEQPRLHHAATDWPLFVRKMGSFEKGTEPAK